MLGQTYGDFLPDCSPFMFSKATNLSRLSIVQQNLYVAAEKQNKTKPKYKTKTKNGYPWVLENPSWSLMEFEIIQVAFLNESQFQYFCVRIRTMLLKALDKEKEERLFLGSLMNAGEKLRVGKLKAKIIS